MKRKKQIQKQQQLNRNRGLALVEIAHASGAMKRLTNLASAQYLLLSMSAIINGEIEDLLKEHGLMTSRMTSLQKNINKAFDAYLNDNSPLIRGQEINNWAKDLDTFQEEFYKFTGVDPDWQPDTDAVEMLAPILEDKYGVTLDKINKAS